jgi:glutathione S-transferase
MAVLRAELHRAGADPALHQAGGAGLDRRLGQRAQQVFDVLEQALDKGPWLLGDDFSAADIAIGSGLDFAVRRFKMVPTRPAFARYLDACAARPAFQRAETIAAG